MSAPRRKLIEVALPLEAINRESAREKSIRHGHPSTLHLWWARRPLAACRAVIFASIVDDPASRPDLFPDEAEQSAERARLLRLIEELVRWESATDPRILKRARAEIDRYTSGDPPPLLDPFCGGGSIPLEAQRLGLRAFASDLNPVPALITKALVELPAPFENWPPVNQSAEARIPGESGVGAEGLAEDVRYYGRWIQEEAFARIGSLYPPVACSGESRPVIAWVWTRTVACPNPACRAEMPLVRSFVLDGRNTHRTWIEPVLDGPSLEFRVRGGDGNPPEPTVNRRGARCITCDSPAPLRYVRAEASAGRMGRRLMAVIAKGEKGRHFCQPDRIHIEAAEKAEAADPPESSLPEKALSFRVQAYGMTKHRHLFTQRELLALETFSDLVDEARTKVTSDALHMGHEEASAQAYGDTVATYLGLVVGRASNYWSSLTPWGGQFIVQTFGRQALAMVWDFAEANPFSGATGSWTNLLDGAARVIERLPVTPQGSVRQLDATQALYEVNRPLICTDPPYYDNIGYADLADYFYVWLRRSLKGSHPELFSTLLTPKAAELVATPHRFGGDMEKAREHFEGGLDAAFSRMRETIHPQYPLTFFYAFKQAEADVDGIASTGWETMLEGLLGSDLMVTGTWPMRTERDQGLKTGTSVLASSIVLVCRPRPEDAAVATRGEFRAALRAELPEALRRLQSGSIAPVDLAQAAVGPGIAVFSRYPAVIEAGGDRMRVRTALTIINDTLDELMAEQEADFDSDTRWCVAWFEQNGMDEGPFGVAETLSRAKNTAINGLIDAGVISSRSGKVRLLDRSELQEAWDPASDTRLTIWEVTQHLIARHQTEGEKAAAALLQRVGGLAVAARELAYRLFSICEREGWAQEALAYNALVTAWPEITQLAAQGSGIGTVDEQQGMEV